ncbi:MAG: family 43 glycosylhydrolase [Candidatus Hydrogenedentota bacterium]
MGTLLNGRTLWLGLVPLLAALAASAAPNPVLPDTADVGVLRFAGEYYLMGMGTAGGMYTSRDLVHWDGPHHAFSMDNAWTENETAKDHQIHACNLVLHNGRFHLYWSVNHGALRQIGHAVAGNPRGPYHEPVTDTPFDGRMDPQCFVDRNGELYFYTVKFTDGNVIFGQPMADPCTLAGAARPLLSAQPDTWEMRDHKVNEAPEVVYYRRGYTMLYNANHTGSIYGNYAIGAAAADAPLGFGNSGKYPHPVLGTNQGRVLSDERMPVPVAVVQETPWRYTTNPPGDGWAKPGFDDTAWQTGPGAFGGSEASAPRTSLGTRWSADALWLRKRFDLAAPLKHGALVLHHRGRVTVYLNGTAVAECTGATSGYAVLPLENAARALLQPGDNVLAVAAAQPKDGKGFADAGLLDPGDHPAEPIVHNCGQPNLVRGPNGFEWWLVYFALYNGSPKRSQAIDRVHFFGDELVVDGPTTAATQGYHPPPAQPTFMDTFDTDGLLGDDWVVERGEWFVEDGALVQPAQNGLSRVRCAGTGGQFFQFEASVRFREEAGHQAGIATTELIFGLDRTRHSWFVMPRGRNDAEEQHHRLPENFAWDGWHTLRLAANGLQSRLWIDGIEADTVMGSGVYAPVRPELFARGPARFDGVTYTRGWDGVGDLVDDWAAADSGSEAQGKWVQQREGLLGYADTPPVEEASGPAWFHREAHVFKGDRLPAFEWTVQVVPEEAAAAPEDARAGVYALYADRENFLRVAVDPAFSRIEVAGMRDGEAVAPRAMDIPPRPHRRTPLSESGGNLRIVKLRDRVILFAAGHELMTIEGAWPPAQAGLFADGVRCRFRGIMLFERVNNAR